MENKRKHDDNRLSSEETAESTSDAQLPEWHPFAVWQTQIRNEQTSQTGTHRVLRSVAP